MTASLVGAMAASLVGAMRLPLVGAMRLSVVGAMTASRVGAMSFAVGAKRLTRVGAVRRRLAIVGAMRLAVVGGGGMAQRCRAAARIVVHQVGARFTRAGVPRGNALRSTARMAQPKLAWSEASASTSIPVLPDARITTAGPIAPDGVSD